MKSFLYSVLLMLVSSAAFGQFNPPEITNYQNGDTVYKKVDLLLAGNATSAPLRYMVEASESDLFNLNNDVTLIKETKAKFSLEGLAINTTYYIRVRILSGSGFSNWSKTLRLTVGNSIEKITGWGASFDPNLSLYFNWVEACATGYRVQFDVVPGFNSSALYTDTVDTAYYRYYPQKPFAKFYARVAPMHKDHLGEWSKTIVFADYSKPLLIRGNEVVNGSKTKLSLSRFHIFKYRYQVAYDSLFTSVVQDTTGSGYLYLTELPFDTALYFRVSYIQKQDQSAWSQFTIKTFKGPKFTYLRDGDEVERNQKLSISYLSDKDDLEIEVAKDSLFQFSETFSDFSYFKTSYRERRQFIRMRAIHGKDTSSWNYTTVDVENQELPVYFNRIRENDLHTKVFAPDGILNFLEYGQDFEKVWVELDTVVHFESAAKVSIESTDKSVGVPDLYFDQTYYVRYRVAYTNGYEEKKWSTREVGFQTMAEHSQRIDFGPAESIERDFSILPVEDFEGFVQFQLFSNRSYSVNSMRLDTLVSGYSANLIMPFDTSVYYRARLVNKVDVSKWVEGKKKSYARPLLIAPEKGSFVQSDIILLTWKDTNPVCQYTVQIDTLLLLDYEQGRLFDAGSSLPTIEVELGKKYFWRVKATTSIDVSDWSKTSNFTVDDNSSVSLLPTGAVQVYPNPASQHLFVSYEGTAQVRLLNLQGQEVLQVHGEGTSLLNLSSVSEGVYIVEVQTDKGSYRQRIEKR